MKSSFEIAGMISYVNVVIHSFIRHIFMEFLLCIQSTRNTKMTSPALRELTLWKGKTYICNIQGVASAGRYQATAFAMRAQSGTCYGHSLNVERKKGGKYHREG